MEVDPARHLVFGDAPGEIGANRVRRQPGSRLRLDRSCKGLAELLIGNAEHGAIPDPRTLDQCRFDLGRINVDAGRDHHVRPPIAEIEPTVLEIADVADADQPVALDRFALGRVVEINEIRKRILPDIDLADLAGPNGLTVLAIERDPRTRRRTPDATGMR